MSVEKYIDRLREGELLDEPTVIDLCEKVKELLFFEGNIVPLQAPVTVVSNVHGQLSDLLEIFRVCGPIPDVNYVFAGDMADYGYWGIETVCLLFCYRLRYPSRVTLLRGEHESRAMTKIYGLYLECLRKYGTETVWHALTDTFDYLPVAATVDNRAFIVHGGIPRGSTPQECLLLDKIRVLNRFTEIPQNSAFCSLFWNDPTDGALGFQRATRGAGELFGPDIVDQFCHSNRIERIIRGHQLCPQGFQAHFGGRLFTVWSAPNFLGRCGNAGAALEISDAFTFAPAPPLRDAAASTPASDSAAPGASAAAAPTAAAAPGTGTSPAASPAPRPGADPDGSIPTIPGFRFNTFLAAPRWLQKVPEPSPDVEIPRGIPEYFQ